MMKNTGKCPKCGMENIDVFAMKYEMRNLFCENTRQEAREHAVWIL